MVEKKEEMEKRIAALEKKIAGLESEVQIQLSDYETENHRWKIVAVITSAEIALAAIFINVLSLIR